MKTLEELKATRDRIMACTTYSDDLAGRTYKACDLRDINQEIYNMENGIVEPTMHIVINKTDSQHNQ